MKKTKLAIVGATGLVGQTFLHILQENNDEYEIKLFASEKSKGKRIKFKNKNYVVHVLNKESFDEVDCACFFTNKEVAQEYVPIALNKGVKVIDNSSCFRMQENVPLVVAGVNDDKIQGNLVSNPNCCVIQSMVVINTLKELGIKLIIYNTYQSVSGSGKKGIDELIRCRKGMVPQLYETDISFTCIPKIGEILESKFTEEEDKMEKETKKILGKEIDVFATCVRVPVMFSHGVTMTIKLEKDFDIDTVLRLIKSNPNIVLCDKISPTSVLSCKNDKVYVGRIRKYKEYLIMYCVADNIRVGAASNSYQLLKKMNI